MDDSLFVHFLNAVDELSGDVEAGLKIELATALREQILETLAEQVHHHHVVGLAVFSLLVTDKVEEGDVRLAS